MPSISQGQISAAYKELYNSYSAGKRRLQQQQQQRKKKKGKKRVREAEWEGEERKTTGKQPSKCVPRKGFWYQNGTKTGTKNIKH